jgi:MoaA/NifB/PqqE/SkfB family radical SAM enzyme
VGGEPLLHPDIVSFMKTAREIFPKSRVQIITNGLLLIKMKADFWDACKKYNITMTPTKYPGIDWERIEKRAEEHGYKFSYFGFTNTSTKASRKFVLDLTGGQDAKKAFENCCLANCSIGLHNGRLATCSFVFNMRHFNNYFNQSVPVTDADSIDIYKAKNIREILDFLASPIPLCRYCKSLGEEIVGEWRTSKKEISEWT